MTDLTTKRSIPVFYSSILFALVFMGAMGAALIHLATRHGRPTGGKWGVLAAGACIILLALYSVYRYFKNAPITSVDHDKITMGSEVIYWSDVLHTDLTGKQSFPYIFTFPMEGIKLILKNGQKRYLFDDMYSNLWQIKAFISEVVINKNRDYTLPDTTLAWADVSSDRFDTFKGNVHTSMRGIMLWFFVAWALFLLCIRVPSARILLMVSGFLLFWSLVTGMLVHYFQVSDRALVVRNHLFSWKKKVYPLSAIREVAFETQHNAPYALRVICKDYRTYRFMAGSLRKDNWLKLKEKLEERGITVRNELWLGV